MLAGLHLDREAVYDVAFSPAQAHEGESASGCACVRPSPTRMPQADFGH